MQDFFTSHNLLLLGTLFKMETINPHYMILLIICYTFISFIINSIDIGSIKGYIENHTQQFINDVFNNKTVSIVLTTHTITIQVGYSEKTKKSNIYSDTFMALLDYIGTSVNIKKKKEILTTQLQNGYCTRYDNNKNNRFQFIPSCFEDILINKKLGIFLRMTNFKKNDDDDDKNKNLNDLEATLYCYYQNHNDENDKIKLLKDFIEKIEKDYIDKITKKDDKRYIFDFQKIENNDEGLTPVYSKHLNTNTKYFKNLFMPEEDKQKLIEYVEQFKKGVPENVINEFVKMGNTYRAGLLFYGSPGCGKTSAIKAILNETNRHGVMINLSKIKSNEELEAVIRNELFNKVEYKLTELCLIFEDCDATNLPSIEKRKESNDELFTLICNKPESQNSQSNDKIINDQLKTIISQEKSSFDLTCLLNIIDGIISLDGIMIIFTSNHPDKIDQALLRPGRVDFKYEFKKANKEIISQMMQLKYNVTEEQVKELKTDSNKSIEDIEEYKFTPPEITTIMGKKSMIEFLESILKIN